MRHKRRRRHAVAGSPPGTLIASLDATPTKLSLLAYGPAGHAEVQEATLADVSAALAAWPVTWVNVEGVGRVERIAELGRLLKLHPLALEDAVNVQQRAKVEEYPDHLFIVARMATPTPGVETEQLSLFLAHSVVVTFQEGLPGDPFGPVRERIRKNAGSIRARGADYLAYSLLDAVIDAYFPVLEDLGERLEQLEDAVILRPDPQAVGAIHQARRDLLTLRRAVWPLRDAMNTLLRDGTPLIAAETRLYLRDCYDHTVRIIDFVETYRELAADLMDIYLSSVSQRMNEIMKVLTIVATIFIPLTFISSIYGMNFSTAASPLNMPELNWYFGYPLALGLMAAVSGSMLLFFWWRGWLGSRGRSAAPRREQEPEGFP